MTLRLEAQLAGLAILLPADLRTEWERLHGAPAPRLSPELMRMGLAYALQVKASGKLPARYARQLDRVGKGKAAAAPILTPGTQLVRSWNGRTISVAVVPGGYEWEGTVYRSLTAIARIVTGAAWSGPRFFGLTGRG
ncbi:DUF2924 domain-containing protein [Croceibacterium sp. TMG7-5b_MA50]|uniref:DUF2924 domain-containing protein n=1 Tax=Croceibacterium sp. TMG7-5b_MA50 TaxID=3121290 RepID=UPI003222209C